MPECYVIFEDSPHWMMRIFKKNFRHVSFVVFDRNNVPVHVNPRMKGVEFLVLTHEQVLGMFSKARERNIKIVHARRDLLTNYKSSIMFFTCVELVKRTLGIQNRWLFTPWQLYKHLRKES